MASRSSKRWRASSKSAVAGGGYRAAVLTYLDAMNDAVRAPRGPMPAAAQEAWLASVAMRLGH